MADNPRDEGYMRCICGQWAVGVHSECRALAEPSQLRDWLETQGRASR